jgi:tRNA threonylcarbamoyladenosine biosynthesis protein TsaE
VVKSPTYTLVEPYQIAERAIYHFDLYRLAEPDELEYMGIRDYLQAANLCLIEWPEKAADLLPSADLQVHIQHEHLQRKVKLIFNHNQ